MLGRGFASRCVRSALQTSTTKAPSSVALHRARTFAPACKRSISLSAARLHGEHDDDHDFVPIGKKLGVPVSHASAATHSHDHDHDHEHDHEHDHDSDDDSDDEDMVDTVALGPSGVEYGGPQRGGMFKEPTRFGDWERKGRCSDF